MIEKDIKAGDLIRGDLRVIAVHQGNYGRVLIVRQELPGGYRVYKAVKTFLHESVRSRDLFERELACWVRLPHHPNVVQARDADTVEKLLVLEFVRGPSLEEVIDGQPLAPRWFLEWARQITEGLRFLHVENGFIHRDLRPANVLIDASSPRRLVAKISDLGIGKYFDPGEVSGTVIGNFRYMAPETYRGRSDFRSDIFCLGATLHTMATGRPAVAESTSGPRRTERPSALASLPEGLSGIISRCLERDPENRFQSTDDVVEALSHVAEWPMALRYDRCERHGFDFATAAPRDGCAFCAWETDFRRREERIDAGSGRAHARARRD